MDLPIALNLESAIPLHQQLYEALRQAILKGRLLPGTQIPSTRSFAQSLSISRATVTQSYERLLSEGYLEARQGSGTFVCTQLPDDLIQPDPIENSVKSTVTSIRLSQYGARLAENTFALQAEPPLPISFRYGRPALNEFPIQVWRKLLSRHSRATDTNWLDYATDFCGYLPLREAIAQYLARARAVCCTPDQIVVTNGTQQALDLVMRLLMEPGELMAIEDPGYLSARRVFLSHGAQLIPVPVDASGLVVEKLAACQNVPRLVYVTPSHQFPTGAILSLSRRLELLNWAQQQGALILEDDYDSEYRYGIREASLKENRPIPALQGLDQGHSVIYIATFSKMLFPALRIGYLVLPPNLVSLFAQAKWLHDRQLPLLEQLVLTDFIQAGHLESHIRKMRSHYDQKRQTLVNSLNTEFGKRVTILGEQAGIHLMVKLQTTLSDQEIIDRAAQSGVGLLSAQPHYLNPIDRGEFIFGYGELSHEQIKMGVSRLAQALS